MPKSAPRNTTRRMPSLRSRPTKLFAQAATLGDAIVIDSSSVPTASYASSVMLVPAAPATNAPTRAMSCENEMSRIALPAPTLSKAPR
ncbi:MAG: hypothetical protein FJ091_09355 [Deltaproteobacteria bacterium]|nr:hypothetical protein [Deltaproteobacteria bacterium]